MKMEFRGIGQVQFPFLREGIQLYQQRINKYVPLEIRYQKASQQQHPDLILKEESDTILQQLKKEDFLVLLDEKGVSMDSMTLTHSWINWMESHKKIIFQCGGAYGVHADVKARANIILSLSALTYPHQLVYLIFMEQLYRMCTIWKGIPYHHS